MNGTAARRALLVPVAFLSLVACTFGPRLETFPPAHRPEGARAVVKVTSGRPRGEWREVRGELLEVRTDGLVLLSEPRRDTGPVLDSTKPRIVLVGYDVLREARFEAVGESLSGGKPPRGDKLEKLRRLSRFPQGLPPELLAKLLLDYGQAELEVLRP